jgi:hypothetical protein
MSFGKLLEEHQKRNQEILDLFRPEEGTIGFYYGKVRNGKTYAATADIWDLLRKGEVVIANWLIDFKGFDERTSFSRAFFKFLTFRKYYFDYKPDNLYYFPPDSERLPLVKKLRKEVGVHIFIDEGQWVLNSHHKTVDEDSQKLVLTNGHFCRSLNIISQRPGNVLKDYRSQVTFWYRCQKIISWPVLIFKKTIIEDMIEDYPDEESDENKTKVYFADKFILNSYNTHGMRDADAIYRGSAFDVYELKFAQRLALLGSFFVPGRVQRVWRRFSGGRRIAPHEEGSDVGEFKAVGRAGNIVRVTPRGFERLP